MQSEYKLGVYSEVGKLRRVMVCSPGLAHTRLTPENCDDLLFQAVAHDRSVQLRFSDSQTISGQSQGAQRQQGTA